MAKINANFFSRKLMRNISIEVILPVDKVQQNKPSDNLKSFKTLYLLHGIFGDQGDWISNTRIIQWAQERNLAVVMPAGENRFYVDQKVKDGKYGQFIGEELVEITRRMFPLSRKSEDTFIGGLSMGGYGALINGLRYPNTFGAIVALSSALIIDQVLQSSYTEDVILKDRAFYESCFGDLNNLKGSNKDYIHLSKMLHQAEIFPKLYLACGSEDFLINENRQYHKFLNELGVEHCYVESPGVHDWVYWDKAIKEALDWLPIENEGLGTTSGSVDS